MYPVVCFDVGFTLIDERTDAHDLICGVLAELGHSVDPDALRSAQRSTANWYLHRYHTLDNGDWSSDATIRRLWLDFYEHLFSRLDPTLDHQALADRLIAHYENPANWQLFADVEPTLSGLRQRGVKIGVVSDWSSLLRPILHGTGLSRWIDFVVGSADSGFAKPMSDLYRLAIDRAGVPADQIIHIGDSYFADVLGARAVGMQAALIDRAGRAPRTDCRVLRDLREILVDFQA
jgi:putative hydrolase of the HAD superfamily